MTKTSLLSGQKSMSVANALLLSATTVALGYSTYWMISSVREYGWDGTLRLIWEGDPYPEDIRECIDKLDGLHDQMDKLNCFITSLEEGLERARLDTVDQTEDKDILKLWNNNIGIMNLRTQLGQLSYDLDKIAGKIDAVPAREEVGIRDRKKEYSKRIVRLMKRVDIMIEFFEKASA